MSTKGTHSPMANFFPGSVSVYFWNREYLIEIRIKRFFLYVLKLKFFEHLNFFLKLIGLSEYAYLKIAVILTLLTFKSIDHVLNVFTSNISLAVNSGLRKNCSLQKLLQTTLIMIDGVAVFPLIYR